MTDFSTVILELLPPSTGLAFSALVDKFGAACAEHGIPPVRWKGQEASVLRRELRILEAKGYAHRFGVSSQGAAIADPLWGGMHYHPPQHELKAQRLHAIGEAARKTHDATLAQLEERVRLAAEELREAREALAAYKARAA